MYSRFMSSQYLCEIPEEAMNQLHLPNGVPLVSNLNLFNNWYLVASTSNIRWSRFFKVYNVKRRCITLLDDGSGKDPMEQYDFGPAAQYLFRPCELDDDFFVQVCNAVFFSCHIQRRISFHNFRWNNRPRQIKQNQTKQKSKQRQHESLCRDIEFHLTR